eukprot:TRINITY_DN6784_c0_g1_i1.p1 TRINITY_DN6784_c0_g1~~TRINITY_DN6784_c0_g1_i1.p1  ORF type:complete len:819 (-),score=218.62 TRINITY_DN6784_c0_g1_i1:307-2763(-)
MNENVYLHLIDDKATPIEARKNTLCFLQYFFPLPSSDGKVTALLKEISNSTKFGSKVEPALSMFQENEQFTIFLRQLCALCALDVSQQNITLINSAILDCLNVGENNFPFCWTFVQSCLFDGSNAKMMVDMIVNQMEKINCLTLIDVPKARVSFAVSLLILREILTQYPSAFASDLAAINEQLEPFSLLPIPFCTLALDMLEFIKVEARAPGTAMRKRFEDENPLIRHEVGQSIGKLSSEDALLWNVLSRTIVCFVDGDGQRSALVRSVLRPSKRDVFQIDKDSQHTEMERIRKELLVSIIEGDLNVPIELVPPEYVQSGFDDEMKHEIHMNDDITSTASRYATTVERLETCQKIPKNSVKSYRESVCGDLLLSILPEADLSPVRRVKEQTNGFGLARSTHSMINLLANLPPSDSANELIDNTSHIRNHMPRCPDPQIELHVLRGSGGKASQINGSSKSSGSGNDIVPLQAKLKCEEQVSNLLEISRKIKRESELDVNPLVRIAVLGDDSAFSTFLMSISSLLKDIQAADEFCNLQLLYIPTSGVYEQSRLARHLSKLDPFYERQVYFPFSAHLPFAPPFDHSPKSGFTPTALLRRLAIDYCRMAKVSKQVPIFECRIWQSHTAWTRDADETIAFCCGVDIGKTDLFDKRETDSSMQTVQTLTPTPNLVIAHRQLDLLGRLNNSTRENSLPYAAIEINCDTAAGGIESGIMSMTLLPFRAGIQAAKSRKKEDQKKVAAEECDEVSCGVIDIEVAGAHDNQESSDGSYDSTSKREFSILVDGVEYKNVTKIRLSRMTLVSESIEESRRSQVFLPIRTFI